MRRLEPGFPGEVWTGGGGGRGFGGARRGVRRAARGARASLVLLARRAELLASLAAKLEGAHHVTVRTLAVDSRGCVVGREARGRDARRRDRARRVQRGLRVHREAPGPPARRRVPRRRREHQGAARDGARARPRHAATRAGRVVLMSSLAGFQGAPRLSAYAASKAFNIVLGESLWAGSAPSGVDVVTCCAGAIRTPNYQKTSKGEAPGTLDARSSPSPRSTRSAMAPSSSRAASTSSPRSSCVAS